METNINVIADSSLDYDSNIAQNYGIDVKLVPFKLYLDEKEFTDDDKFNVFDFIDQMINTSGPIKSSCPSPHEFMEKLNRQKDNYIVTISSKLSGAYNSAVLAKNTFSEEVRESFTHVFDSKSASIAETLVSLKIFELDRLGVKQDELVKEVESYIGTMQTLFISESLNNLIRNGRISKFKGLIANALNIKPIMGAFDGQIELVEKTRGSSKAFRRLVDLICEKAYETEKRILAISHVNNMEMATWLKDELSKRCNFKDIIVVQTNGLSSLYCDNKGIIVSF